ncbi:hypothetical protein DSCO28_47200 [Desulfosarcina ovata subsp. sediminis]|uniref:Uncharacterized protein n=1 Tax=Desulfosarcina ovata subsp. sediminis TaxID=885957 RepID=A0A5K7ZVF7_9BACT|nr:hypothetical protein DSCO28_47200 [Desulfosarcina ovata subsp. sediminis]
MLPLTFQGLVLPIGIRWKEMAALVTKPALRPVHVPALAALDLRYQGTTAMAARR